MSCISLKTISRDNDDDGGGGAAVKQAQVFPKWFEC